MGYKTILGAEVQPGDLIEYSPSLGLYLRDYVSAVEYDKPFYRVTFISNERARFTKDQLIHKFNDV
jgi:hypothetical protein